MSCFPVMIAWTHLAALLLGYSFAGWLLAAFQVSWLIWLGTLGTTLHLIRAQASAIALAASWVVLIMVAAAVVKAWAAAWDSRVPFEQAQLWAQGLLLIWLGAMGLVVLLAFARPRIAQLGMRGPSAGYSLTILIWGALAAGGLLYQTLPQP
jgi:hypothetical protein